MSGVQMPVPERAMSSSFLFDRATLTTGEEALLKKRHFGFLGRYETVHEVSLFDGS